METYDATDSHEEGRFFRRETDEQAEGKRILGLRPEGTRTLMEAAAAQPAVDAFLDGLEQKGAPARQFVADVQAMGGGRWDTSSLIKNLREG